MRFLSQAVVFISLQGLLTAPLAMSWEQDVLYETPKGPVIADQWGLAAIGVDEKLLKKMAEMERESVVVAVIDSGVDPRHPDLPQKRQWINEAEQINGIDDDGNGYIDDRFGWDFIDNDNDPNDKLGHGTHVAGIIAAQAGNGFGIAGLDSKARIMPLRALNIVGRGYSTRVAAAIYYATDMGADIINLSMAIDELSNHESRAVDYAVRKEVLVVAASGNDADDAANYTPAGIPGVVTVAASDRGNKRAAFSNFGNPVDIAAPGVDIVSLRAWGLNFVETVTGEPLAAIDEASFYLSPDRRYMAASGTSFAAPFVSAAAALRKSIDPELTAAELARLLKNSAVDLGDAGINGSTGYGLLNVPAVLAADPGYFIDCRIDGVTVLVENGAPMVEVLGTADSDALKRVTLRIAKGQNASDFGGVVMESTSAVRNGAIGRFDASPLATGPQWTLKLEVEHLKGSSRSCRFQLSVGS